MNDSGLWAQSFRWYEQLRVVDDMNYTGLQAQASGGYEQLGIAFIRLYK